MDGSDLALVEVTSHEPDMLMAATKMRRKLLTNGRQMGEWKTDIDLWAKHKNVKMKKAMDEHSISAEAREALERHLVAPFSGSLAFIVVRISQAPVCFRDRNSG